MANLSLDVETRQVYQAHGVSLQQMRIDPKIDAKLFEIFSARTKT